jgi:two-component system, OmpR family, sensor kinase
VSLRGRLLLSAIGGVAAVLAALTIGFNVVLEDRLEHEARSVLASRAAAELSALQVVGGRIVITEAPDDSALDSQIWVFGGRRLLEAPRSGRANDRAAAGLAGGPRRIAHVRAAHTELLTVPVVRDGRRVGTVVAGVSLRPYEDTRRTALIASLIVGAAALAAVALAARWLISRALRPVSRMTHQAADWSEHDLDRRFALGEPRDELTELAATLDALLERLASSLRHEQRFTAELSHELRTPLANVVAEAQFALRHASGADDYRASIEQILQSANQLSRTLDTLMAVARAQLDPNRGTSDAWAAARTVAEASEALASREGVDVAVEGAPARVAVTGELVERILAPIVENACRHGRTKVRISVRRAGAVVLCTVEDDGPGVAAEDREAIFAPGRRGRQTSSALTAAPGIGLGLSLARRLARAAAGEVEVLEDAAGGAFVVRLPAA